jgi:hypothetical protein
MRYKFFTDREYKHRNNFCTNSLVVRHYKYGVCDVYNLLESCVGSLAIQRPEAPTVLILSQTVILDLIPAANIFLCQNISMWPCSL